MSQPDQCFYEQVQEEILAEDSVRLLTELVPGDRVYNKGRVGVFCGCSKLRVEGYEAIVDWGSGSCEYAAFKDLERVP